MGPGAWIGTVHRAGPFRISRIDYPPGIRQPPHAHEAFGLTLVLAGDIRESSRSREETGSALSVVVKPAGLTHADEIGPRGARTLQVAFAPGTARELSAVAPVDRWRWLHGRAPAGPLVRLASALRGPDTTEDELEERVLEAVGRIADDDPGSGDPPGWLSRVKEALDDELYSGVTVRELARRTGVHPVSVSRAFRRHYGRSITEYRRLERVRRAAAAIASSPSDLSRVAHRTGFADHAHLCREFRRTTGLTPSRFRSVAG